MCAALSPSRPTPQAEQSKEARLKGPSPFTLNRLLNIYSYLYAESDHGTNAPPETPRSTLGPRFPAFVVSAHTLKAMEGAEAAARRAREEAGAQGTKAAEVRATVGQSEAVQPGLQVEEAEEDGAAAEAGVGATDASAFLAALNSTEPAGGGGAQRKKRGSKNTAPATSGASTNPAAVTAVKVESDTHGVGLVDQTAHLPHHAGGPMRHSTSTLVSPESAELLSMISSLVSMAMLLRVSGCDTSGVGVGGWGGGL